ncbi:MAG: MBL fold metallo-hydrolase [Candidatus Anammoxibacter sp.]
MKLTILGSGTAVPSKSRGNPGYLLEIANEKILIDGGAGAIRKLPLVDASIWDIKKIFYSHLHIDHTLDLIPLLFAYMCFESTNSPLHKLEIFAHEDFKDYLKSLQNVYGHYISSKNVEIALRTINSNTMELGAFIVKSTPVSHSPQSIAYRFELPDGASLVYSGDTDYCDGLSSLAQNCSALLVECSFPDSEDVKGHMTPQKIARLIKESRPKRVILTHVFPINDDGTLIDRIDNPLNIPINIAEDLLTFVIE